MTCCCVPTNLETHESCTFHVSYNAFAFHCPIPISTLQEENREILHTACRIFIGRCRSVVEEETKVLGHEGRLTVARKNLRVLHVGNITNSIGILYSFDAEVFIHHHISTCVEIFRGNIGGVWEESECRDIHVGKKF